VRKTTCPQTAQILVSLYIQWSGEACHPLQEAAFFDIFSQVYGLLTMASLVLLAWDSVRERNEVAVFFRLIGIAAMYGLFAAVSSSRECGEASVIAAIATAACAGVSAFARAATGRGGEVPYRLRWNLVLAAGVLLTFFLFRTCISTAP
jgi:hypothetical protein